jgi:hypothetical protein
MSDSAVGERTKESRSAASGARFHVCMYEKQIKKKWRGRSDRVIAIGAKRWALYIRMHACKIFFLAKKMNFNVGLSGNFPDRLRKRLTKRKKEKREIDQETFLYAVAFARWTDTSNKEVSKKEKK